MESLLKMAVAPARPHALPFRVIIEEYRLRRIGELLSYANDVLPAGDTPIGQRLEDAITAQETAYQKLADAECEIKSGHSCTSTDGLVMACQQADLPLKRLLHKMDSSALCLSGGGIRSASYCLGILEGLSRFSGKVDPAGPKPLMHGLDYLSTVSGGGYIGSWLTSWIYRRWKAHQDSDLPGAYGDVIAAMAGKAAVTGGDPEAPPMRTLRSYTSYLAPELGLTLDTFTLFAIVIRNLVVNWTMLIPVIVALVSAALMSGFFLEAAHLHGGKLLDHGVWPADRTNPWITYGGVLSTLLFGLAATAAGQALPSHRDAPDKAQSANNRMTYLFLLCVVAGCWLLTASASETPGTTVFWSKSVIALVGFGLVTTGIAKTYFGVRPRTSTDNKLFDGCRLVGKGVMSTATMAAATGGLLYWLQLCVFPRLTRPPGISSFDAAAHVQDNELRLFAILALPLVITVLSVTTSIYCGLMGLYETEDDREWWVRCGGWLLAFNLGWIIAHGLALYGDSAGHFVAARVSALVIGLGSSYLGFSPSTAASGQDAKQTSLNGLGKFLVKHDLVLPVAGGLGLTLIALTIVTLEERLRDQLCDHFQMDQWRQDLVTSAMLFAIAGLAAVAINRAININLFSLHGMYRMRLMRAFLGASNVFRHPDPFTQFDWRDTPYEMDLPCGNGAPLHVINATLNLTGTKNPAWRQRKGEGFSFSPVACGGWRIGYVPTRHYGGSRGLTLATAMAISGAAANPNMGYQSSPVLALLMTFFNLRLGFWLPNPKRPTPRSKWGASNEAFFRKSGPSFALQPLFAEALELTDDTYRWVELTDGGHFENLGIYEMVLRRVKHIIVVDAGADPKCQFEDLGNAIRKIEIDLGIPIKFRPEGMKMKAGMKKSNSYCAVADIQYCCVDDDPKLSVEERAKLDGRLVYIKAGLTGKEPADILQYALTHPMFPHETTANQFFTESQFESYRHLGSYVVDCIARMGDCPGKTASVEDFAMLAEKLWMNQEQQSKPEKPAVPLP